MMVDGIAQQPDVAVDVLGVGAGVGALGDGIQQRGQPPDVGDHRAVRHRDTGQVGDGGLLG